MDATAIYGFLNLGDGDSASPSDPELSVDSLMEGDFGEWQLGFQYEQPIGYRAELTQIRNQRLQMHRATKRLEDMELEVTHQLSIAFRHKREQYRIAQTQFNTLKAYRDQVKAASTAYDQGTVPLDVLLDANSRQAQAEIDYFRSLTQYQLAIAEIDLGTGRLLRSLGFIWKRPSVPSKKDRVLQTAPAYENVHILETTHSKLSTSEEPLDYRYAKPLTRTATFVKN